MGRRSTLWLRMAPLATLVLVMLALPPAPAEGYVPARHDPERLRFEPVRMASQPPSHAPTVIDPAPPTEPVSRPDPVVPTPELHVQLAATPRPRAVVGTVSGARAYALELVGSAQFACLDVLWQRESGWDTYATNPSSGAYGIPQALPGSKMGSAGADWATNPITQVRWGVGYITSRYGSSCAALGHSNAVGWY